MKKIFSIVLLILWMILIFVMSSFNASKSSNHSGVLVNFIANILNISDLNALSHIIRKLAHFTEYFILGVFIYNMVNKWHLFTCIGIIICMLYAFSDEFHQIFVPGRSFQVFDILIDICGGILGIFCFKKILK